jgi:excisionase family DNA binding protein
MDDEAIVFYTPEQAGSVLKVSTITIRRYIQAGELKASRVGKRLLRISSADLQKFIADKSTAETV